jgi:hypothetical protein
MSARCSFGLSQHPKSIDDPALAERLAARISDVEYEDKIAGYFEEASRRKSLLIRTRKANGELPGTCSHTAITTCSS